MGPKKGTNNNASGRDGGTRDARASLAAKARELLKDGDLMLDYYMKIAEGKVPVINRNKEGVPTSIGEKEFGQVTLDQQMLAMARIAERAYGQAPQHTHIEQEIRAEVTAIAGGVDVRVVQRLSPDALRAIKAAVLQLPTKVQDPKGVVLPEEAEGEAEEVVDAEFEEKE